MVLWEIYTRRPLFDGLFDWNLLVEKVTSGYRQEIPADALPSIRDLITRAWAQQPQDRPHMQEVVDQLETILIELAISEPLGREIWKKHFWKQEQVPWETFCDEFYNELGISAPDSESDSEVENEEFDPYMPCGIVSSLFEQRRNGDSPTKSPTARPARSKKPDARKKLTQSKDQRMTEIHKCRCLRALLEDLDEQLRKEGSFSEAKSDSVHILAFGQLLDYFGPLASWDDGSGNYAAFIENIYIIVKKRWFFGKINARLSTHLVSEQEAGNFLVRLSRECGSFTVVYKPIDAKESNQVEMVRVQRRPGNGHQFIVGQESFEGLVACVKILRELLPLKKPCSGSRFNPIFSAK
eukprot:TRINITY_DN20578_c0_g1_i1.p1 TRINITY_DN20578_c0_g1~~TRINITY_DN20578_c0_g1_i1.p1  ORF type:complete len:353 (+),score=58.78 TRINITY_DN20578_c0_g1_i1:311-1369(+)